jgi:hypothetical protein
MFNMESAEGLFNKPAELLFQGKIAIFRALILPESSFQATISFHLCTGASRY